LRKSFEILIPNGPLGTLSPINPVGVVSPKFEPLSDKRKRKEVKNSYK
jgi:hypothetical protein